jgi:hypothetical protein
VTDSYSGSMYNMYNKVINPLETFNESPSWSGRKSKQLHHELDSLLC